MVLEIISDFERIKIEMIRNKFLIGKEVYNPKFCISNHIKKERDTYFLVVPRVNFLINCVHEQSISIHDVFSFFKNLREVNKYIMHNGNYYFFVFDNVIKFSFCFGDADLVSFDIFKEYSDCYVIVAHDLIYGVYAVINIRKEDWYFDCKLYNKSVSRVRLLLMYISSIVDRFNAYVKSKR